MAPSLTGVDVAEAEAQFEQLSRRFSRHQEHDTAVNSQSEDIEKGAEHAEDPFDLREYLASSNDANLTAGLKHKHVGVTWEDLSVHVTGNIDSKVLFFRAPLRFALISPDLYRYIRWCNSCFFLVTFFLALGLHLSMVHKKNRHPPNFAQVLRRTEAKGNVSRAWCPWSGLLDISQGYI